MRTNGLGDWAQALDEALTGPASQHIAPTLHDEKKVFTERLGKGNWQYEVIRDLHEVLIGVVKNVQPIGEKAALRTWFHMFAEVRNKTRGHGAPTPAMCAKLAPKLEASIKQLCEKNPICKLSWAYLHRNLSGKYRVVVIGGDPAPFEKLKSATAIDGENYADGVYLWAGQCKRVELIHTDLDASDFFLPNGAFDSEVFELHSLITDSRLTGDAKPYMDAAGEPPTKRDRG